MNGSNLNGTSFERKGRKGKSMGKVGRRKKGNVLTNVLPFFSNLLADLILLSYSLSQESKEEVIVVVAVLVCGAGY